VVASAAPSIALDNGRPLHGATARDPLSSSPEHALTKDHEQSTDGDAEILPER